MSTTSRDTTDELPGSEYLETIELLQQEIARLESELRMLEDISRCDEAIRCEERGFDEPASQSQTIASLTSELAERDQTIDQLWEQVVLLEEAASARRAEWDQLYQWVDELERRIESRTESDPKSAGEIESLRHKNEELLAQLGRERDAWTLERRSLESEVEALRGRLQSQVVGGDPDKVREKLERENRRLRQECHRLAAAESLAAAADSFRSQLQTVQDELERARQANEALTAELVQRRIEHEAELAAIRTQVSRARVASAGDGLSINERMRALRDHLSELHEREIQERNERKLSTRIARMWKRTSVGG